MMGMLELEKEVKSLINQTDHNEFIYDLLALYGTAKSTLTRLKKGNDNLSKKENQLIVKKKLFFERVSEADNLLSIINSLDMDSKTHTHSPRFIIVTDFRKFLAKDTKTKDTLDIAFTDLWLHTDFFLPWTGKEKYQTHTESLADVKAAEKMAKIYDEIIASNPKFGIENNHELNVFLTRLLFCFFAEDTGIFAEESLFTKTLSNHTKEDGSDLKDFFELLFNSFDVKDKSKYPVYIQKFPYVNGSLFSENLSIPNFSAKARKLIFECGDNSNWKEINPDIFGSMFQAVKTAEVRSGLGQHYTSVPNIMKVINPLFMDELREEFEKCYENIDKLKKLQIRLSKIRIFDPACGSGNFLIIAFKQMKLLEMDIIKRINTLQNQNNLQMNLSQIELKQFYGIEIDDFACEIAKLSLWLAEHQMNCKFQEEIGNPRPTLPLCESGHIVCGNACRLNWEDVCPKYEYKKGFEQEFKRNALQNTPLKLDFPKNEAEVYILGNPPYKGFKYQTENMKNDIAHVFSKFKAYKKLDYIACWFYKASTYIENTNIKFSFVSTNSITQGEQISLLWKHILKQHLEVNFAYTSFKWTNNARKNAGIICVIIGVSKIKSGKKFLYSENMKKEVDYIPPSLNLSSKQTIIEKRGVPISNIPTMLLGSCPADGGALILTKEEKDKLLESYPLLSKIIKSFIGSSEYIKDIERYCLWIEEEDKELAENNPFVKKRLSECAENRLKSDKEGTRQKASTPYAFTEKRYKNKPAIIMPITSSERRKYIPVGFINENAVVYHSAVAIYDAKPWIFGIVTSNMHMVWMRAVAGRLKTDYRYSATLVYNTFPFPDIDEKQKKRIELCVNDILAVREKHSEKTMAELYDPDKMPKDLLDAHHSLDLVIEQCYKKAPFKSDEERLGHLFKMYEMMTNNASDDDLKQLELL